MENKSQKILYWLVALACLTPIVFSHSLLSSAQGAKAFYFQILVEAGLPFYVYLILRGKRFRPGLRNFLTISILAYFGFSFIAGIFGVNFSQSF